MKNPTIRIHNVETNEVIDREMSDEEFVAWNENQKNYQKQKEEFEKKQNARQSALAKLAALGLTEEEIAAL